LRAAAAPASRHGDSRESRRYDVPARHEPAAQPAHAAPTLAAPSLAPAPTAEPPPKKSSDILPRGEWEPPRKRVIDTSNPYGEDK
jgi:hypothetical protein